MLSIKYAEACVEILDILEHMNINDLAKVSGNFIEFLRDNASKNYICKLDYSKKLNDMELKKETRELLALMYEKYWCTEEEKEELQKRFYENEKQYQIELREKYNPDNVFKNNKLNKEIQKQELALAIVKEETFISRIINKIKSLFKK